jgi:protein TonB
MAKLDIYKLEWIDVVFLGRNKSYGAYELRKDNSKTTTRALWIGSILFILLVSSPLIIKFIGGFVPAPEKEKMTEVVLAEPPPLDKTQPPPPPPEPPKPKVDQVKFPPPVVVPANEVKDEEPPTIEKLKVADPGQKNIEGDINAEVTIDVPVGNAPKEVVITEDNTPISSEVVQVQPAFPGGQEAWLKFMQGYNYPAMARENNVSGKVYVRFVVEKDGSLTDISVVRDLGFGTGEEAVRLLKTSKRWKPGIQNGRPVRVTYTQPISLAIQ